MILQALVQHLLKYRSCWLGSVVPIVCSVERTTLCIALLSREELVPEFRVGLEVSLPTLTTWVLAVRKSRIQAHSGELRPISISLSASLIGTMVLKVELKSISNALTESPF